MMLTPEDLERRKFWKTQFEGITGYMSPDHVYMVFLSHDIYDKLWREYRIAGPIEFYLPKKTEAKRPVIGTIYEGAIVKVKTAIFKSGNERHIGIDELEVFDPCIFRYYLNEHNIPVRAGKYRFYLLLDKPHGKPLGPVLVEFSDNFYILLAPGIRDTIIRIIEIPGDKELLKKCPELLNIQSKLNEYIKVYANNGKAVLTAYYMAKYFPNYVLIDDVIKEIVDYYVDYLNKCMKKKQEEEKNQKEVLEKELRQILATTPTETLERYLEDLNIGIIPSRLEKYVKALGIDKVKSLIESELKVRPRPKKKPAKKPQVKIVYQIPREFLEKAKIEIKVLTPADIKVKKAYRKAKNVAKGTPAEVIVELAKRLKVRVTDYRDLLNIDWIKTMLRREAVRLYHSNRAKYEELKREFYSKLPPDLASFIFPY